MSEPIEFPSLHPESIAAVYANVLPSPAHDPSGTRADLFFTVAGPYYTPNHFIPRPIDAQILTDRARDPMKIANELLEAGEIDAATHQAIYAALGEISNGVCQVIVDFGDAEESAQSVFAARERSAPTGPPRLRALR